MEFISRNADEVLIFCDGHLLAGGSPIEVFSLTATLEKAGVIAPEAFQLSSRLGLPTALTAEQLVSAWLHQLSGCES